MPISDYVLDNGLGVFASLGTRIDICHTLPTTYAEATSTYSVGNKTGISISAPSAASPNGRLVTVSAVTDGTITTTSTTTSNDAEFWAITDPTNSRLLISGSLASAQMVTSGNIFTLNSFTIRIPSA